MKCPHCFKIYLKRHNPNLIASTILILSCLLILMRRIFDRTDIFAPPHSYETVFNFQSIIPCNIYVYLPKLLHTQNRINSRNRNKNKKAPSQYITPKLQQLYNPYSATWKIPSWHSAWSINYKDSQRLF